MLKPLTSNQLYHPCNPDKLEFDSTGSLGALEEIPGQKRALEAIEFGIGIQHEGYNLYVMGPSGLGKHSVVQEALREVANKAEGTQDWCYINNFDDPHQPHLLRLPTGMGNKLVHSMRNRIEELLSAIPEAFESDDYHRRALELKKHFREMRDEVSDELDEHAQALDIVLMRTSTGFTLAPMKNGEVIGPKEFEQLPEQEQDEIEKKIESLKDELSETMRRIPAWQKDMHSEVRELDREIAATCIDQCFANMEQEFREHQAIAEHLQAVKGDILDNMELFREQDDDHRQHVGLKPEFNRYQINLLVDNSHSGGCPVIYEDNPTYQNLIGRVEHIASMGTLLTDFTLVKAGSLHKANGGYLILDAEKVLTTPFVWQTLKRVLKSREIRIESLERVLSLAGTISLEPEPVPAELKVILIGDRILYFLLKEYDPEFIQLFKVAADFSEELPRDRSNEGLYASLIATIIHREKLREFELAAVCRIIEQSSRQASDGEKLSLHLDYLQELLQESDYWAGRNGNELVSAADVQIAIDAQARRLGQWRERLQEHIKRNVLMIDTDGRQLGRINGLSVLQLGDYSFGTATRISATARLGSGDIVDIEREVDQGGQIHSKGVMILGSYLARRYSKNQPLSLSATLVFEQTYGMVEGDSASAAELCALLSAIGDLPLKQSLAVTGSINQHGEMQAIGGVNEKIEGFYEICKTRGLGGDQGVIIPLSNCKDLMLCEELRRSVEAGEFHIYAARHTEEAMELLCGMPPGTPDSDGVFPEGGFNHNIQLRLLEWIALRRHYANPQEDAS